MPPEIKLASLEKPDAALREALARFSRAIAEDIANLPDDTMTRVHDIRVATKKIRALLLLAGKRVSKAEAKILFGLLRGIRGAFAGSRDVGVMRSCLSHILPEEQVRPAFEKLLLEEHDVPVDTTAAINWTAELNTRIEALDLDGLKLREILGAACDSHRIARKLRKKCHKLDDDVLMHEWRKRVKEFAYHTMALEDLKPMGRLVSGADELAETLGDYHDLALLTVRAGDEADILDIVVKTKKKAGKKCLKLAAEVFEIPPSRFEKKLLSQI